MVTSNHLKCWRLSFACWLGMVAAGAAEDPLSLFHRGYYLQHEQRDLPQALRAYDDALEAGAGPELQAQIREQIGAIEEDIAGRDLAGLMPSETFVYAELVQPGWHLEQLVRGTGLAGRSPDTTQDAVTVPIGNGLEISSDFQISPALLRELGKVQGVALGITGMKPRGPEGVLIIHPGESDIVRGLIETGLQVVPQKEAVAGFPTYSWRDRVWFVRTRSLVFCSSSREQIEQSIARIGDDGDSLNQAESFRDVQADRKDALAYVHVDGPGLIRQLGPHLRREAAVARMVLDLDHLSRLAVALATDANGVRGTVRVAYQEGHHSLAYGLFRTEPYSGRALAHVPSGAAVVAALGINPNRDSAGGTSDQQYLTAMDIGREVFANMSEVSFFVLPSKAEHGDEVPDFGLVVVSNDGQRSEALWNQWLSVPASLGIKDGFQVVESTVNGQAARTYSFADEDIPPITVLRWKDNTLVAGTDRAVAQMAASAEDHALPQDPLFSKLLSQSDGHRSKALYLSVGRMLELASQMEHGQGAKELQALRNIFRNLTVTACSDESPTEWKLSWQATGLPQWEDVLTIMAEHAGQRSERVAVQPELTPTDEG